MIRANNCKVRHRTDGEQKQEARLDYEQENGTTHTTCALAFGVREGKAY